MKKGFLLGLVAAGILLFPFAGLHAEDMRAAQREAREKKANLLHMANKEKERAAKEAKAVRQSIFADKSALNRSISLLEDENGKLETEIGTLEKNLNELESKKKELLTRWEELEGNVRELVGFVRVNAKDMDVLLGRSQQSALVPGREMILQPILNQTEYPGMDHIRSMVDLLFDEIVLSGQVRTTEGPFVNRAGEEVSGRILVLGNFSAAYQSPQETGFLLYSHDNRHLFALSKLPPPRMAEKLEAYVKGASDDVPMDISKGAALRQLTHQLSLMEQIPKGGPIVYPILGIGILALLIILERMIYLFRKRINADRFVGAVCDHAIRNEWDKCADLCRRAGKKPIPSLLLAGINSRDMSREDMENVLQEAILNEIPKLERFLSTLGMLAAIAPLLGLLGTVTGMINTFHVITSHGTGDPRMMSGGISEALVTTMLGLAVAIPIMLCHTLLSGKVENLIGQMEKKAVTFVNTVFKAREEK
jgi:biopolymer transport protein ExbB